MNRVILLGNLGMNPEIKLSDKNTPYAILSLATHEQWTKTMGKKHQKTEWHRVVVLKDSLVNFAKTYLKKGSKIAVEGKLQTRSYTTNEGHESKSTEVIVAQGYGYITSLSPVGKPHDQEES